MKFGLFYEHQLPQPWGDGAEQRLCQDALEQVELGGGGWIFSGIIRVQSCPAAMRA